MRYQRHIPLPQDSPVEAARKAGPRGDGKWPGFGHVYAKIAQGCEKMGQHSWLSDDHIQSMADLGSGHEERMKYRLHWLRTYGWIV